MNARQLSFRFIRSLLAILFLTACGARNVGYKGTCAQQTQQFLDSVHSFVVDEITPAIDDGFKSGPTAHVMKKIETLNGKISELEPPECNPKTQAVKDALGDYMIEVREYFSTVAGRDLYGEGPVQGQLSKMYEAGLALEIALEDVRK
jgi:hypothetical protein